MTIPDPIEIRSSDTHADLARLNRWLETLVADGGSDLLLIPGAPPSIRFEGEIRFIDTHALEGHEIEAAVLPAMNSAARQAFRDTHIADSSYHLPHTGRFRINLHHEKTLPAATIRALPSVVPAISDLSLPPAVEVLSQITRGLILVGGPAGSGKSTTVAALVNEVNRLYPRHIITIEDPIEYEHTHNRSIVEQIEIGVDAPDFPTALRAALRQAPDVIVVGEMRDSETMRIAVAAAETGHLVFSTLHTTDVSSTISRISDSFPIERQNTIRQELAMSLAAVMTQNLLPSKQGGRIPAAELLVVGYGARQHIRRNALQHLHQELTLTKSKGSFSFEESLAQLVLQGHVDREDALLYAAHPDDVTNLLKKN